MSAKLFLETGQVIPQADFSANEEENGKWRGSQSFWIKKGNFDDLSTRLHFRRGRTPSDLDPKNDDYFDFLKVAKTAVDTETGGYTVIRVEYQGFVPPIGTPPPGEKPYMTTSYRATLRTVSISEHPKYQGLSGNERRMMDLLLNDGFTLNVDGHTIGQWIPFRDETAPEGEQDKMTYAIFENIDNPLSPYEFQSDESQALASLIASGRREYEIGTFEYVVRWSSDVPLTAEDVDQLGLVANPPGNPVKPSSGSRDWKLTTINQEQEGTEDPTYTIEIIYLLSNIGGWDETLYTGI